MNKESSIEIVNIQFEAPYAQKVGIKIFSLFVCCRCMNSTLVEKLINLFCPNLQNICRPECGFKKINFQLRVFWKSTSNLAKYLNFTEVELCLFKKTELRATSNHK